MKYYFSVIQLKQAFERKSQNIKSFDVQVALKLAFPNHKGPF